MATETSNSSDSAVSPAQSGTPRSGGSSRVDRPSSSAGTAIETSTAGKTTIAEGVVSKVAGIAARNVPGVYALGGGGARAIDGDVPAFEALVRRHAPMMRAYVARMVGSVSAADDVVQDALVLAWRKLPDLQEPANVKAWMMRIAGRQALTRLRRREDDVALGERQIAVAQQAQPENVALRNEQLRALSEALDELGEDQRRCWLLREVAGLSYEQIAEEMDISASTARGRLARARTSIYARMEGWR